MESSSTDLVVAIFAGLWLAAMIFQKLTKSKLFGNGNGNGNSKLETLVEQLNELQRESVGILREMATDARVECERRNTQREQLTRIEEKIDTLTR